MGLCTSRLAVETAVDIGVVHLRGLLRIVREVGLSFQQPRIYSPVNQSYWFLNILESLAPASEEISFNKTALFAIRLLREDEYSCLIGG